MKMYQNCLNKMYFESDEFRVKLMLFSAFPSGYVVLVECVGKQKKSTQLFCYRTIDSLVKWVNSEFGDHQAQMVYENFGELES
jgi:hypothetical protein